MFGLDPDTTRNIKLAFAKIPDIDKVILYGSRAKGNYHNGSDIDITLLGKNLTLSNSVYPLMDELEELYLPYMFDISVFSAIDNEKLVEHINRTGKVFYQRKKGLPKGWEYGVLDDVVRKCSSNISLNKTKEDGGKYPVFGAKGFVKNISFFQQEKEYLAIIKDGAGIGRVSKHPKKSSVLATMQYLIPKEEFDIGFVEYFLNGINFKKYRNGSTIPHIYFKDYKAEPFPILPLPEQKRIVAILDQAFTAIAKAKANAEQNLKNAHELFQSALQTEFVNGKSKIENGEWQEKKLGEIALIQYGYTDKSIMKGDYRYIRITDIDKNGELIITDKKYIKYSEEAEKFVLNDNDLLMARTGATFAKVLLYKDYEASIFASYLIKIKFTEKIENVLYWYFTKTRNYWKQANTLSSGAAQPHFNGVALKKVIFSYPKSISEQRLLIKKIKTISTETKKLETIYQQKINDLNELKKCILQKTFNGEL